ncbi:MAG: hypothetical protein HYY62_04550 [Deltaproteobacteria bacterium]|nr:hypothetical protein [Deltaproteobacteria bacterium]
MVTFLKSVVFFLLVTGVTDLLIYNAFGFHIHKIIAYYFKTFPWISLFIFVGVFGYNFFLSIIFTDYYVGLIGQKKEYVFLGYTSKYKIKAYELKDAKKTPLQLTLPEVESPKYRQQISGDDFLDIFRPITLLKDPFSSEVRFSEDLKPKNLGEFFGYSITFAFFFILYIVFGLLLCGLYIDQNIELYPHLKTLMVQDGDRFAQLIIYFLEKNHLKTFFKDQAYFLAIFFAIFSILYFFIVPLYPNLVHIEEKIINWWFPDEPESPSRSQVLTLPPQIKAGNIIEGKIIYADYQDRLDVYVDFSRYFELPVYLRYKNAPKALYRHYKKNQPAQFKLQESLSIEYLKKE